MKEKKPSLFVSAETDKEKSERLLKGSIFSMVATFLGGIFITAWMIAVTQILGPKDFGIFGPLHQFFWAAVAVISLGIPIAITTFGAHHWEKDKESAREFFCNGAKYLFIIGIFSLLISIIISSLLLASGKIILVTFFIILVLSAGILFNMQFQGINSILLGVQRTDYYAIGNFAYPTGTFLTSIGLVFLSQKIFGKESLYDIVAALIGICLGSLSAYLTALFFLKKVDLKTYKEIYNFKKQYKLFKKIISFGWVTTVANLNYNLFNSLPSIIVGLLAVKFLLYAESLELNLIQSGYFSAGYLYSSAGLMIMGLTFPLIPALSEAEAQGRKDLMQHYLDMILKYAFMLVIITFGVYALVGGELVNFLAGKEYPVSAMRPLIVLLSLTMSFVSLFFLLMNVSFGVKHPEFGAISITVGLIVQVIGLILGSYIFQSILAPVISLTLAGFTAFLISAIYLVKKINLKIKLPLFIVPLFSLVIAYLFAYFLIPRNNFLFFLCAAVFLVIYGVIYAIFDKLYLGKITANKF